ncbi:TlpA family protein disulfide reductase [Litorimonas sp. RW-G-Af-16]|uniref:TlpA family protein disulfide reductase n=1 Tax=Litorimonas sp. RW-G-Af-16 TaxID=3241168 RepID=UPI00390C647D
MTQSLFTLGNAIRALILVGLVAVMFVVVQSCQKPKTGLMQFSTASLKKLTVLDAPPPQPSLVFNDARGQEMTLADYKGQVVLLNVWATWCPPCVAEMPTLDALQALKGGKDFQVVTVSMDRTPELAMEWLEAEGLSELPAWHDGTYALNDRAQLPGLPTSILYDRGGRELARIPGEVDWMSEEAIAMIDYAVGY